MSADRRKYRTAPRLPVPAADIVSRLCALQKKANGQELFDKVTAHLELLEKDYFGLLFTDPHDPRNWLQLDKGIKKQLKSESVGGFPVCQFIL